MKTLTIILLLANLAFASTEIYDIKSDDKQIGTLSVKTKTLANEQREYKTHLKISIDSFLFTYKYEYRENALFDTKGLLSFHVKELDDGIEKIMSAKREGSKLLFANGEEILLREIDITPFDMDEPSKYDNSDIKEFNLKSFDGLTGEVVTEMYKVLQSSTHHLLEKRNSFNDEVEVISISKEGKLLKVESSDYEMVLRK